MIGTGLYRKKDKQSADESAKCAVSESGLFVMNIIAALLLGAVCIGTIISIAFPEKVEKAINMAEMIIAGFMTGIS